jgi:hypothetical protein
VNPAWGKQHANQEATQQTAMAMLFCHVAAYATWMPSVRTRAELATGKEHLLADANILSEISQRISRFSPGYSRSISNIAAALSNEIERRFGAGTSDISDFLIVEREGADPALRGYIKMVAFVCRSYFNKPLYSTVARIANVSLEQNDIDASRVRTLIGG